MAALLRASSFNVQPALLRCWLLLRLDRQGPTAAPASRSAKKRKRELDPVARELAAAAGGRTDPDRVQGLILEQVPGRGTGTRPCCDRAPRVGLGGRAALLLPLPLRSCA